jgi:replication factor A1
MPGAMKLSITDYYNLVSDLMPEAEFKSRISKYNEKYSGLLTDEVLAHLIVDELGRNVTNFTKLVELRAGTKVSLFAIVTEPEPRIFSKKKDKRAGAMVNIFDSTGKARLLLWDTQHVELIENKKIKVGTKLKIINGKISSSTYGIDITPEKFESLIIEPPDFPTDDEFEHDLEINNISSIAEDGPVNVVGTIASITPLRTFNRKNGSSGSVLNLELYDGTGSIRITLWDNHAKTASEFNIGDQLKIINGYSKLHQNEREIHSNYQTRLTKDMDEEK